MLEIKSKYDAEFRRIALNPQTQFSFNQFYNVIEKLHGLHDTQFNIYYTDKDGDLLPINNDCNLSHVLQVTITILRLIIQRRGECYPHNSSQMSFNNANSGCHNRILSRPSFILKEISTTITNYHHHPNKPLQISYPEDFRPVSAIIDVDILPETYRRVRLHKHKANKPLGFHIRDGRSLRVTPEGVEQVPGIFISRLMPGGLAESTGLLSVNDEVVEVNGIQVTGKTLDQVTDMMIANSSNLIITVKPTNQRYTMNWNQDIKSSPVISFNRINQTSDGSSVDSDKIRSDLQQIYNKNSDDFEDYDFEDEEEEDEVVDDEENDERFLTI